MAESDRAELGSTFMGEARVVQVASIEMLPWDWPRPSALPPHRPTAAGDLSAPNAVFRPGPVSAVTE